MFLLNFVIISYYYNVFVIISFYQTVYYELPRAAIGEDCMAEALWF